MHTNYSLHGDDIIPYYSIQEWIDNWDELFNRVEVERETIGVYDNNNYCLFVPFSQARQRCIGKSYKSLGCTVFSVRPSIEPNTLH